VAPEAPLDNIPSLIRNTHRADAGHGWVMFICCIPMLIPASLLVARGVANTGFLFAALACTAMMALMIRAMGRGDRNEAELGGGRTVGPRQTPKQYWEVPSGIAPSQPWLITLRGRTGMQSARGVDLH
jgi:hypothetical protein